MLVIEGLQTEYFAPFGGRYTREEFLARAEVMADWRLEGLDDAGHMLHHDQPEALAIHLAAHFTRPQTAVA